MRVIELPMPERKLKINSDINQFRVYLKCCAFSIYVSLIFFLCYVLGVKLLHDANTKKKFCMPN